MTVEEFREEVLKLIAFDESDWSTGQDFTELYNSNVTFQQVSLYAKPYCQDIKHYNFIIDKSKVEALEEYCNGINDKIGELINAVDSPDYHPNFAAFARPKWDVGFELNIFEVNKQRREEQRRQAYEESALGKFVKKNGYSPCDGCQLTNCKHCEYGDDGDYSVYDVYSTSELI